MFAIFQATVSCIAQQRDSNSSASNTTESLRLISKPKPAYTDSARKKKLEGTVRLRITFLATGQIGDVIDVTKEKRQKLEKYGLTAQAIAAAQKIKFYPAQINGVPTVKTITIEYVFTLY